MLFFVYRWLNVRRLSQLPNFVKHEQNCWTMGLDDSAHFPQLNAARQCLSYFFAPQLYTPIIVSQNPANHAVLSSHACSPTTLMPYRVNKFASS